MRSTQSRQAGYTLVELMVAMLLLLIVLAAFIPVFLQGLNQSSSARFKSLATNIAREKVEQIRQLDYREIQETKVGGVPTTDPRNLSQLFGDAVTVAERNMTFSVTYAVEDLAGQSMKSVEVIVDWIGPPRPSPAVVKTLVAQEYLGPRGAWLEVANTTLDTELPGPTPFPVLPPNAITVDPVTTVKYHIAEADWLMAYSGLEPLSGLQDISLTSFLKDDTGATVGTIDVDNSGLRPLVGSTGVTDIYFEYSLDTTDIPDGYWDLLVTMFNKFNEPGNTWDLRVRVETGPPKAPTEFLAWAMTDTRIDLAWKPGDEHDRVGYVLERQKQLTTGDWPGTWEPVANLDSNAITYFEEGADGIDPWGSSADPATVNYYRYRIYGVDAGGLPTTSDSANAAISDPVRLPPLVPPPVIPPTVDTVSASAVGSTTAVLGGNVAADGGSVITRRGVCWSTSPNPTTANSQEGEDIVAGTGIGGFTTSAITGFTPGTTYHFRAFATNSAGTSYGEDLTFTTAGTTPPPVLYTVTLTTKDKNSRDIVVKDAGLSPMYSGTITKNEDRVLQLADGEYGVFIGTSTTEFSHFRVSGQAITVTIP